MAKKIDPAEELLREVEELCAVFVGKDAEGEQWGQTCERFVRLDKLARRIRKTKPREA